MADGAVAGSGQSAHSGADEDVGPQARGPDRRFRSSRAGSSGRTTRRRPRSSTRAPTRCCTATRIPATPTSAMVMRVCWTGRWSGAAIPSRDLTYTLVLGLPTARSARRRARPARRLPQGAGVGRRSRVRSRRAVDAVPPGRDVCLRVAADHGGSGRHADRGDRDGGAGARRRRDGGPGNRCGAAASHLTRGDFGALTVASERKRAQIARGVSAGRGRSSGADRRAVRLRCAADPAAR